jgi:hypothetical protein
MAADIAGMIMRDVQDDVAIHVSNFAAQVEKKGLFSKRKSIVLRGAVKNKQDRDKIEAIANHHAGDLYSIENHVEVRESVEA